MEAPEIVALLIVGALGGTGAAMITAPRGRKKQNAWISNLVTGIMGALVGNLLFDLLNWKPPDILNHEITAAEILMAFVGAVIVIVVAGIVQRR